MPAVTLRTRRRLLQYFPLLLALCVTLTWFVATAHVGPHPRGPVALTPALSPPDTEARAARPMQLLSAPDILAGGTPYLIYGTAWKKDDTARLVEAAVHAGFRFIDTACQPKHYSEPGVGAGWRRAADALGLRREDISLQTKFTPLLGQDPANVPYDVNAPLTDQVRQSVAASLANLKTPYLDSLVLHSPLKTHELSMEVWRVFEDLIDDGRVRRLGLSNIYDLNVFKRIYTDARVKPVVLQNRFYKDSNFDTELRAFCKDHGVTYQSFWTLTANRAALGSEPVMRMATGKGLTPQTLMYAFMMALGHTPLSGTTHARHMEEDVALMRRVAGGEAILSHAEVQSMAAALGMPGL